MFNKNTNLSLIHITYLSITVSVIMMLFFYISQMQDNKEVKNVIAQVQSYDSAIKNFTKQYNVHPAYMLNAKDYWEEAIDFPNNIPPNSQFFKNLESKDRKGLGKSIRIWQRLALSNNAPGYNSNDKTGMNLIFPAKNPIYANEKVPSKISLFKLFADGELITPFQMNNYMALILQ